MSEPNQPQHDWHLDRRLQITHILSTAAMIVGATMYLGDIRKDVELLKAEQASQSQRDARQDRAHETGQQATKERLDRIDDKLDRLIEFMRPIRRP
jgi:hypothetical protein